MEQNAYGSLWNQRSTDADSAMAAVDGSGDEAALRQTGLWSANQVIAALGVDGRDHVLELGCGVGRIGRELAGHCGHWTGVDIAENMIRHARVRLSGLGNVSFHTLNRSALDMIEPETVDKAYSIAVFCHMDKEDLYLYLQDLHRVLRPGGLIFVETWNLVHPVGWRRWEYEPLVWSRADQGQRKEIGRNQFCTPEEFALYVSKAGFDVLANYDQSQSVQIVASKGLDAAARQAQVQRLNRDAPRIVYSPLYAELFGLYVDVIFGAVPAAEMLAFMDDDERAESPEVGLFRPHLMAMWRKKGDQWGELPG
jgi:cyclopropane fatty-acyl-phospholipid synthase-like methyltransferase